MNKTFKYVGGLKPSVNRFNLSFDRTFDADFGELIPILGEEMVPGQKIELKLETVIRMMPTIAPILNEIDVYAHFFFVACRNLMEGDDWEQFITKGVSGEVSISLPRWNFSDSDSYICNKYSLGDYFDLPVGVEFPVDSSYDERPIGLLQRAYNFIYNEYYRDINFQNEADLGNNSILNRCWAKDYFTSALPSQQRGVAPALPLSGFAPVYFSGGGNMSSLQLGENPSSSTNKLQDYDGLGVPASGSVLERWLTNVCLLSTNETQLRLTGSVEDIETGSKVGGSFSGQPITGSVNFDDAVTFNVSDLRLAFQVQKWMERNMRAGVRYTEFLKAHFGVSPTDSRLQRPEYVGGCKSHVIVSEVAQTSSSDGSTPQGNLAGKGLVADFNKITKFTAPEFGYLVGIMSIMPKAKYFQGLDKKFTRTSPFDWLMPEFVNLSEQPVYSREIYFTNDAAQNSIIFGYQGIYNEMRSHQSKINGALRDTLDYWHLGRKFGSRPVLNSDFLECNAERDGLKRIFAVQDEKGFVCNLGFRIRSLMPLPVIAEPGLIDHH